MMKRMQEKMRRETKALTNYAKAHEAERLTVETEKLTDEHMQRLARQRRAAEDAEAKRSATLREERAKRAAVAAAEETAYDAELMQLTIEQEKREKKITDAKARGRARAIQELRVKDAEEQEYKKKMEEMHQQKLQEEALEEMRLERIERANALAKEKRER